MRSIITIIFIHLCFIGFAQQQNNNWCFGRNAGITFNTNPPTSFTSNIVADEGVATMSHKTTGALLFYATSYTVYDRNFNVMPNGVGIGHDTVNSSSQGVVIVPFINDTNKYYLFTLNRYGFFRDGQLAYSVVDMTLNGGLGDVVAGQKYMVIDTGFAEQAVVTEGCLAYWLIVRKEVSGDFYAYRISASGINTTPVISPSTYSLGTSVGTIKVSPDRTTIGVTGRGLSGYIAIHDFNRAAGLITNGRLLNTASSTYYGCEFSPNSKLFYVSDWNMRRVYQYDLSLPTTAAIQASRKIVPSGAGDRPQGALQMGPDSCIYVSDSYNETIGKIPFPNITAPTCGYIANAIPLQTGTRSENGLPLVIVSPLDTGNHGNFYARRDTNVCVKYSPFVMRGRPNAAWYEWQDGSTADTLLVSQLGTYWVRTPGPCGVYVDTVVVSTLRDTSSVLRDTLICNNNSMQLNTHKSFTDATYLWNTGDVDDKIVISDSGTYWVTVTEECHVTLDSVVVGKTVVTVDVTQEDTTLCYGDTIQLQATVAPAIATMYGWSTGDSVLTNKASAPGRYAFEATYMKCTATDDVLIENYPRIHIELGEDKEVCADEPVTLPVLVTSEAEDKYLWQDGSTYRKYVVKESGLYYVTVTNFCGEASDTVNISVRNCYLFFPSGFSPDGNGRNDIARLVGDIGNVTDFEIRIFNRRGEEVFFSNDVHEGWNGTYKGQPAAQATYYYYIKLKHDGIDRLMKGDVILVR